MSKQNKIGTKRTENQTLICMIVRKLIIKQTAFLKVQTGKLTWPKAKGTDEIHHKYINVFSGIWCFKGTFTLQFKEERNPF